MSDDDRGEIAKTSVYKRLTKWFETIHRIRGIGAVAGPPGLGKTAAAEEFARLHPGEVLILKVAEGHGKPGAVLRELAQVLQQGMVYSRGYYAPNSPYELRHYIRTLVCDRLGISLRDVLAGNVDIRECGRITIIVDEAQFLHRGAVERLRFYNDPDGCFSLVPLGLVFIGNSEFFLEADDSGETPMSRAVSDRLFINEVLTYQSLTNDDVRMVAEAMAHLTEEAVQAILKAYGPEKRKGTIRSLRSLNKLFSQDRGSAESPLTAEIVSRRLTRLKRTGAFNENPPARQSRPGTLPDSRRRAA